MTRISAPAAHGKRRDVYRQALERVSTTDDPGASRLGAELARLLARQ
ncbi:hypothetical protein RKD25_009075 [Streptomyces sp. SAI-124]